MDNYTAINAGGFEISGKNENVLCLEFIENKKISFLPVDVYKVFPKLVDYSAVHCSLEKLASRNFEHLLFLKYLYLQNNHIAKIEDGTFDYLKSLEILDLSEYEWFY